MSIALTDEEVGELTKPIKQGAAQVHTVNTTRKLFLRPRIHQGLDIKGVALSCARHLAISSAALIEYDTGGSGVLIDGLAGSVADSVGHCGKVAPQPIKLIAQAVSIALVLSRARFGFSECCISIPPVVLSEFQRVACGRQRRIGVLLFDSGDLFAVAPGLHLPRCAKGQGSGHQGGCDVCAKGDHSHNLHQLSHMAQKIGFIAAPLRRFQRLRRPEP